MILRTTLIALVTSAITAFAVLLILNSGTMSSNDRAAFRTEVRAYLLENPEVLMEAIGVLENRQAEAAAVADETLVETNADALFDDGHSWAGGNLEGDITIVEFVDYRCGFCKRAHPEVAELVSTDGNIRIITKEYPVLGEQSVLASRFAVAVQLHAGDDTYKLVSDALMEQRSDVTVASLSELSNTLGLDTDAVLEMMDTDAVTEILQENQLLGMRLQISGTPTFVFQNQMVRGYEPLDGMRQIVEGLRQDG